jgi:hypothetical protein
MLTAAPTAPEVGLKLLMLGAAVTVNVAPLLPTPPAAVTTTDTLPFPIDGTTAVMLPALQFETVAAVVPNVTLPLPCDEPKFEPAMTIDDPTAPVLGVRLLMLGAAVTVNVAPLLPMPPAAVTTTDTLPFPIDGTTAVMLPALQFETVAVVVPNVTLPLPCDEPKFEPAMTMDDPTAPLLGVRLVMLGAGVTVNKTPLLATPFTVTTTLPVVVPGTVAVILVELKLVIVAVMPLKVTFAFDWLVPKLVPAITTDDPTAPLFGVRLVIVGAANAKTGNNAYKDSTATALRRAIHASSGESRTLALRVLLSIHEFPEISLSFRNSPGHT